VTDSAVEASPAVSSAVTLSVVGNPLLVTEQVVRVRVGEASDIVISCDHEALSGERHRVVRSTERLLVVPLGGLLADSRYTCTADVESAHATRVLDFEFQTQPLPEGLPTLTMTRSPEFSPEGYTLFNVYTEVPPLKDIAVVLVDPEGRIRWYWFLESVSGAGIDVALTAGGHFLIGGGNHLIPTVVSPSGEVVWQGDGVPAVGEDYHHHAGELDSGELVLLTGDVNGANGDTWKGFGIEILDPVSGDRTWTWASQTAVDRGQLQIPAVHVEDPYHANSATVIDDDLGPAVWVSLANLNSVVRIDRDTSDLTHSLGIGGDFMLFDALGQPVVEASSWFYGQHDPEFDLPRVLLHDNGHQRPGELYSRVLELELDLVGREARVTQDWREEGWYEPILGDADRLASGNVLVSRGRCWNFCGSGGVGDRLSNIAEFAPPGEVVWKLEFGEDQGVYRAERIDGCALFNNIAYCAELDG